MRISTIAQRSDVLEFCRFFIGGVTATLGNIFTVWCARRVAPFEVALVFGIVTGASISFMMSKFFAFRSRSVRRMPGEIARFAIVYLMGSACYWSAAVAVRRVLLTWAPDSAVIETACICAGAFVMMIVTYLGHRYFTYAKGQASLSVRADEA